MATEPLQLTPTNTSAAPIHNFPAYTLEILSSDSLEPKVSDGLEELLSEYNYRDYLTIQSHYLRERDYEGDYGKVTESEEVTEIWYFDSGYSLRAFSREYFRSGEGRDTKLIICLFSNDSLKAATDYWSEDNQIGMTYHKKMLSSKCPACGTNVRKEAGASEPTVDHLNENDLASFEREFFTNVPNLMSTIGGGWNEAEETVEGFIVTINFNEWPDGESGGKAYSKSYTINKDLYAYSKRLQQQVN